jgi:transposase-like protein
VCAGCAVRGPCLRAALHGPQARDDHSGIFAGTTARQRVALRGRASYAEGTRFVHDKAAAAALELANQVSIDRAAPQLGVSKQALRRAFDHHGLPQPRVFQGGPQRTRFYDDRQAAEQAWRRAAEVGINQTRKELGVSDRALRTAWRRHGLGLPPRPTSNSKPATRRLDAALVALNRKLPAGPVALGCGAGGAGAPYRGVRHLVCRGGGDGQRNLRQAPGRPGVGDHPPRPTRPPPHRRPPGPHRAPAGRPRQPGRPERPGAWPGPGA